MPEEPSDLVPPTLPDGVGGVSADTINTLVRHAQDEAARASKWYFSARRGKKSGALWLRSLAIVLASGAAAVPIINEVTKTTFNIPLAVSSLLLVVAALFVGIDRLFGFSSSWARYAETGLRIGTLLHEFQMKEQLLRIQWAERPTVEQARASIELIQNFLTSLDTLVMAETQAWIQEFQQGLSRLDAQLERANQPDGKSTEKFSPTPSPTSTRFQPTPQPPTTGPSPTPPPTPPPSSDTTSENA